MEGQDKVNCAIYIFKLTASHRFGDRVQKWSSVYLCICKIQQPYHLQNTFLLWMIDSCTISSQCDHLEHENVVYTT